LAIALFYFVAMVAGAERKPLWLVVGKADLVKPIGTLAQWRRSEGFETVVSTETIPKALAALPRRPDLLLLVGDDEPGKETESWYLAAKRMNVWISYT